MAEGVLMEQKHKRRPHYSGKYPRRFEEKYKEQNPEKYGDTIEHVISKGSTPAGMHIPIMVDECRSSLEKSGSTVRSDTEDTVSGCFRL